MTTTMKVDIYLTTADANSWTTLGLPFRQVISRIAGCGYDGFELLTQDMSPPRQKELRNIAESEGLEIVAVSTALVRERYGLTLTDPRRDIRKKAVAKIEATTDFARAIDARIVSIGLVRGRPRSAMVCSKTWNRLIGCLRSCGRHANDLGVTLAVEPETRYETGYIHTVDEALKLIEGVGLDSVKVMIDTFHMNMEERSMTEAVRKASTELAHVHFADNNRRAPGMGHIDFSEITQTLKVCGYEGYVGFEIAPYPDPLTAARKSIEFVKRLL